MKIQIDIPKELNKKLKIHKAIHSFASLQEAIIDVLNKNDYPIFILEEEKELMRHKDKNVDEEAENVLNKLQEVKKNE